MLRAVAHRVRSKLPHDLPSIASTVLAILLAAESMRLGQQLLLLSRDGLGDGQLSDLGPAIAAVRSHHPNPMSIMNAHLFGIVPPPPAKTDADAVPVSAPNLKLTGTLARRNPKKGLAI